MLTNVVLNFELALFNINFERTYICVKMTKGNRKGLKNKQVPFGRVQHNYNLFPCEPSIKCYDDVINYETALQAVQRYIYQIKTLWNNAHSNKRNPRNQYGQHGRSIHSFMHSTSHVHTFLCIKNQPYSSGFHTKL